MMFLFFGVMVGFVLLAVHWVGVGTVGVGVRML